MNRINQLLGRIYAFVLVAISTEALVNGFRQLEYLNPVVFFVSATIWIALVVTVLVGQFVYKSSNFWPRLLSVFTLVLLVTWPLHYNPEILLSDEFKPWIWWLLGVSAIAAGTSFPLVPGVIYIASVSIGWVVIRVTPSGGSGELLLAIQDSLHLFILASIGTAMALVLRWQAAKTDHANQNLVSSGVRSAQQQATYLEQSRLDALVHDSVLTTLLMASEAHTPKEKALASKSATESIGKLSLGKLPEERNELITQVSFFKALGNRIRELHPEFEVTIQKSNDSLISENVSEALFEATLQAVDNSIKHAGNVSKRIVSLQSNDNGLKIVVSDDGDGFRPSKISKDRLGIQLSIIARVKNVGGRVFLRSEPRKGTDVVVEWSPHV